MSGAGPAAEALSAGFRFFWLATGYIIGGKCVLSVAHTAGGFTGLSVLNPCYFG